MKKYAFAIIFVIAVIGFLFLLQRGPSSSGERSANVSPRPQAGPGEALAYSGKVLETMDSGGYTYVHVDAGREKIWAAGPETAIEVGDVVSFMPGMEMKDFRSETLDRTFDTIHFVSEIRTAGGAAGVPEGHPPVTPGSGATDLDFTGIAVPSQGKSIADIYADKSRLAGKEVIVRGKVVKFTPGVMGKNWIHLQDGTGSEGMNDLTVTTDAVVGVGDIALAQGVLAVDKDFGFGYEYDIIIEDAKVTVEY